MQQQLSDLTERLKQTFGDRLVSAILYGSAAAGDWNEHHSDLNVLCVLSTITPRELRESEPVIRWWREQGHPPPLLMTPEEVRGSTDCFAIEFHDMKEHRRVLIGRDVIEDLVIDRSFYRAQVEHELRSKQIRLRQKAAETLTDRDRLIRLLIDSISTFAVLGRHALMLAGRKPRWKKHEVISELEETLGVRFTAANQLLAFRGAGKDLPKIDATPLLETYLKEVDALVRFVDGLDR